MAGLPKNRTFDWDYMIKLNDATKPTPGMQNLPKWGRVANEGFTLFEVCLFVSSSLLLAILIPLCIACFCKIKKHSPNSTSKETIHATEDKKLEEEYDEDGVYRTSPLDGLLTGTSLNMDGQLIPRPSQHQLQPEDIQIPRIIRQDATTQTDARFIFVEENTPPSEEKRKITERSRRRSISPRPEGSRLRSSDRRSTTIRTNSSYEKGANVGGSRVRSLNRKQLKPGSQRKAVPDSKRGSTYSPRDKKTSDSKHGSNYSPREKNSTLRADTTKHEKAPKERVKQKTKTPPHLDNKDKPSKTEQKTADTKLLAKTPVTERKSKILVESKAEELKKLLDSDSDDDGLEPNDGVDVTQKDN